LVSERTVLPRILFNGQNSLKAFKALFFNNLLELQLRCSITAIKNRWQWWIYLCNLICISL